jgi:hypothetical protein
MTNSDVIKHHNAARRPKQNVIVLEIEGEMYWGPDVKSSNG